MRMLWIVAALLVAAGVAVWWLARDGSEPTRDSSAVREGATTNALPHLRPGAAGDTPTPSAPHPEGAVVEGRVLAGGRVVAADVRVHRKADVDARKLPSSLELPPRDPVARAVADAEGRFRVEGLPPAQYVVSARDAQGRRGAVGIALRHTQAIEHVRIDLVGGSLTLRGRARRPDGTPFDGYVGVRQYAPEGAWEESDLVRTDDDGRFALASLARGPARLVAISPGVLRYVTDEFRLPYEGEYDLVIGAGAETLAGLVVDGANDRPLAGVVVRATSWGMMSDGITVGARSDVEGRFRVQRLAGRVSAVATLHGYARRYAYADADDSELRIVMQRSGRIRGRVVSATDRSPVSDTRAYARGPGIWRTAAVGVDGTYVLDDLTPGSWGVTAYGGGWYAVGFADARGRTAVTTVPAGGEAVVDLEMRAAVEILCRVLDGSDRPVPDARVQVEFPNRRFDRFWGGPCSVWAAADGEGCVRLRAGVPGLVHRLIAEAPGRPQTASETFTPQPGEVSEIIVRMAPVQRTLVRVLDATDDAPVAGATVAVGYARPGGPSTRLSSRAITDAQGACLLEGVPPGEHDVTVEAPGYVRHEAPFQYDPGDAGEMVVHLRPGLVVRGRVRTESGEPFEGAWLTITLPDRLLDTDTWADGVFWFEAMPPGRWPLRVYGTSETLLLETTVEAGALDVELTVRDHRSKQLVLTVLGPDGEPVPDFGVTALAAFSAGDYGKDGRFELAAGHDAKWLFIDEACSESREPLYYAPLWVGPLVGDEESIEVRLLPGLDIGGVVRGSDGVGIADAHVAVRDLTRPPRILWRAPAQRTSTDAAGRFLVRGLAAGPHELRIQGPKHLLPVDPMIVPAGTTDLELTLRAGIEVRIRVVDARGRPVMGARVNGVETGDDGAALLRGLAPAEAYRIDVRPPESRPELRRLRIDAWRPSEGPITLPEGRILSGRAVDAAGVPVSKAHVVARHEDRRDEAGVKVRADGTFVIRGLKDGTWLVTAIREDRPGPPASVLHVEAGSEDVRVVFSEGRPLRVVFEGAPADLVGEWVGLRHHEMYEASTSTNVDAAKVATFPVDPNATYDLYVFLEASNQVAWKVDIPGDAKEIHVPLRPARTIEGTVRLPAGVPRASVSILEFELRGRVETDLGGRFRLVGIPEGTFTVSACARGPKGPRQVETKAEAGARVEIDLR